MSSTIKLKPYIDLLSSFVNGKISASEFEQQYLDLYLHDQTIWSDDLFSVLDKLFGDVDAYVADPFLRDTDDVDETQLKQSGQTTLEYLKNFIEKNQDDGEE